MRFFVASFASLVACCGSSSRECVPGPAGDEECVLGHGEEFYCGPDGECVRRDVCGADDCCVTGAQGDQYCQTTFGPCSSCELGTCSPRFCGPFECTEDNQGHDACARAFGVMYYCAPDHYCIEAEGCEAEECCVPGTSGDGWCGSTFGACSVCEGGLCSRDDCGDGAP